MSTTGLFTPVVFRHCTSLPGIAPTYVRLCPFISATSLKPPTEKRKNLRSSARAMLWPMLVLPTPGGPTMVMIFPCVVPRSWPTAMNSRMRSLTSSKP